MARRKITKRAVDAAKAGETIWDTETPGFGLRVSKAGARSYVLKYRRGATQRWMTIGRHGAPWTPDTARNEAKKLLGRIAAKEDPAADRAAEKRAGTFAEFAECYLKTYSRAKKKPSTARQDEINLRLHILPVIGRMKVGEVSTDDLDSINERLESTPYAANRCRSLLVHMFKIAIRKRYRPDGLNPAVGVQRNSETKRKRYLTVEETRRLGRVLAFLDRKGASPYEVAAIRLLLFTGCRLGEILSLKWSEVDFRGKILRLSDSKTGAKEVALSAPALAVLEGLKRQKGNPYVICGHKEGAHLVNLHKPWNRIRKAALVPDLRIHDLRHSFAAVGASGNMSLTMIGALLGHSQPATTARYAHVAADPKQAAADKIAQEIQARLEGRSADVIPLRSGK
ncbi:MAG: tyrosine-type recombinase/integrase [Parvularculaceae bacterium]